PRRAGASGRRRPALRRSREVCARGGEVTGKDGGRAVALARATRLTAQRGEASVIGPVGAVSVAELALAGSIADETDGGPLHAHPALADLTPSGSVAPGASTRPAAELAEERLASGHSPFVVGDLRELGKHRLGDLDRKAKKPGDGPRARLHRAPLVVYPLAQRGAGISTACCISLRGIDVAICWNFSGVSRSRSVWRWPAWCRCSPTARRSAAVKLETRSWKKPSGTRRKPQCGQSRSMTRRLG